MATIIGVVGAAGSGKDTFTDMINEILPVMGMAFADPIKDFAQKVFRFTDEQMWGPTSARNGVDHRFSPPERPPETYIGVLTELVRAKIHYHDKNRADAKQRYEQHRLDFILDTMVGGWPSRAGAKLDEVMEQILAMKHITPRTVLQLLGTEYGRALSDSLWVDIALQKAQALNKNGLTVAIKDTRFVNEARAIKEAGGQVVRIRRPSLDLGAVDRAGVAGHVSEKGIYSPEMTQYVMYEILNVEGLDALRAQAEQFVRTLS